MRIFEKARLASGLIINILFMRILIVIIIILLTFLIKIILKSDDSANKTIIVWHVFWLSFFFLISDMVILWIIRFIFLYKTYFMFWTCRSNAFHLCGVWTRTTSTLGRCGVVDGATATVERHEITCGRPPPIHIRSLIFFLRFLQCKLLIFVVFVLFFNETLRKNKQNIILSEMTQLDCTHVKEPFVPSPLKNSQSVQVHRNQSCVSSCWRSYTYTSFWGYSFFFFFY